MATTYLRRTNGTPTNAGKGTFSAWVKRSAVDSSDRILMNYYDGNNYAYLRFHSGNYLQMYEVNNGSIRCEYKTNRLFRDTNAWYHMQFVIDTSESTATDRFKIYINGELETSYSTQTFGASSGFNLLNASGTNYFTVGAAENGTGAFNGLMSHVHFCDGTALAPTVFGSTDSTTGEWKINTSASFTPGNNGFTILKDGNTITDQSANSNDFTLGAGTLTKTEDNPSNVFCTWNPLAKGDLTNNATLSNGNTYYSSDQSGYNIRAGTIGANKGKFYWEGKFISHNPQTSPGMPLGIIADNIPIATNVASGQAPYYYAYSYDGSNGTVIYNSNSTNYGTTILDTIGQIGMVAMDLDNNKVYFGVNGVWTNSANPSNGTGGYTIIDPADTPLGFYLPAVADRSSIREYVYAWNFGNGYFGTTAVSSAGTNASGNGIFEYDVPTGYTALSTKGLNL